MYKKIEKPDRCDACGLKTTKLNIDHDHNTGYIRGCLCDNCNGGIAKLGDNAVELQKRLDYLIRADERYNQLDDKLKEQYKGFN